MKQNINARFESSSENFSIDGLGLMSYHSTGGNPDGYISVLDTNLLTVNYFEASTEFDGHKLKFFGGKLSYDIEASGDGKLAGAGDVEIVGKNGVTLVADTGQAGNDWTHEKIALDSSGGWHIGSLSGALANDHVIKTVLQDVGSVLIRADYATNLLGVSGLDNVRLGRPSDGGHHNVAPQAFATADAHQAVSVELHHSPVLLDAGHHAIA